MAPISMSTLAVSFILLLAVPAAQAGPDGASRPWGSRGCESAHHKWGHGNHSSSLPASASSVAPSIVTSSIFETTSVVSASSSVAASTKPASTKPASASSSVAASTKVTSSSAAPVPTASSPGSNAVSSSDSNAYLDGHNSNRTIHGANAVTWNQTLADAAQTWANKCVFQHSGGSLGPWGENLAAGTGDYPIASGILAWTNEVTEYDPANPVASHFTQVVWKSTTQIGCAVAACADGTIFTGYGVTQFYVCEYSPPGNVGGEYAANVQV